jgi:hypothetical protein
VWRRSPYPITERSASAGQPTLDSPLPQAVALVRRGCVVLRQSSFYFGANAKALPYGRDMRMIHAALVALALMSFTACADDELGVAPAQEPSAQSSSPTPTDDPEPEAEANTPEAAAERIQALPQVQKVITVNEDNDPNDRSEGRTVTWLRLS